MVHTVKDTFFISSSLLLGENDHSSGMKKLKKRLSWRC